MHAVAFAWAFVQLRARRARAARGRARGRVRGRRLDRRRRRALAARTSCQPGPDAEPAPIRAAALATAGALTPTRCRPAAPTATVAAVGGRRRPDADLDARAAASRISASLGWFRARLADLPDPPRPSARSLRSEGGGRLDRLDLWFVIVLVVGAMVLRTYRLEEPYQMHFDEVYHARTATEFLQDWRYGIPHDIYEWTHPHLAKYAMAVGLVLWGEDDVGRHERARGARRRGRGRTETHRRPTRRRRSRRRTAPHRHRHRDPDLRPADARPDRGHGRARARARSPIDEDGKQLVIGYEDGHIATLDLGLIGDGGVVDGSRADGPRHGRITRSRTCS